MLLVFVGTMKCAWQELTVDEWAIDTMQPDEKIR